MESTIRPPSLIILILVHFSLVPLQHATDYVKVDVNPPDDVLPPPQVDTESEVEYCTDIEDDDDDDDVYDVQDPSVDEDVTAYPRPPPFESQEKVNLLVGSLWNGILRNAEDLVWINVKTLKGNCFRLPVDRNGKVEETARHLEDVTGRTLLALRTVHFPIPSHLFQDALSHG